MPNMTAAAMQLIRPGYCFEAQKFFARCPENVTPNTKARISRLIVSLMQAGIWTRLDTFYVFAVESPANALINLKSASGIATAVNSPTFTPNVGYTGNGTNSFVNTNYNPTTITSNWVQNSGCMFGWSNTPGVTAGALVGTPAADTRLFPNVSGSVFFRMNTPDGSVSAANTNTVGLFSCDRPASNTVTGFVRGAQVATDAAKTSQALANENVAFLQASTSFYPGTITLGGFGASLSAQQQNLLYLACRAYMLSVGLAPG